MPPRIIPAPDESSRRTIKRSRVVSYLLVLVAAILLSLRPEVFGDPQSQPLHALLHTWRIVVALLLAAGALAVQVTVGVRWRAGLRRDASGADDDADSTDVEPPGNRAPRDR